MLFANFILFSQTKTNFETSLYRRWIIFQLVHNSFLYYNYLYFGLHKSNRNNRYIEFISIVRIKINNHVGQLQQRYQLSLKSINIMSELEVI